MSNKQSDGVCPLAVKLASNQGDAHAKRFAARDFKDKCRKGMSGAAEDSH